MSSRSNRDDDGDDYPRRPHQDQGQEFRAPRSTDPPPYEQRGALMYVESANPGPVLGG